MKTPGKGPFQYLVPALLILLILPFALYSFMLGWSGLTGGSAGDSRLIAPGAVVSNTAVFLHMIPGALLTLLAPVQLLSAVRLRWPRVHRILGRALVLAALITGAGGLVYIALNGTIGGAWMNAGFSLYGVLLIAAALQTIRYARAGRFALHRVWALRLFVLAIGSWLYRIHYTVWHLMGYDAGLATDFRSAFDLVQNFAFYLPWLVVLEIWLRMRPATVQRSISTQTSR